MKVQQAYFSESNMAGGWQLIGYQAPNNGSTTNFEYGTDLGISDQNSDALESSQVGWDEKNKVALNECESGVNWTVSVTPNPTNTDLTFKAEAKTAGCQALTPTFANIGK